ncbi:hypothetical protein [Candidatus Collinsella stercoripullorum]|uniref:hypothetical protein n=1 Tax=Candidatus Collinsella stercoripullorum TaxID=2838522 RepID=UPI0022E2255E|nr:hypothetical protein [Candidatus Collinsella stercoripullorum]
MMDKLKTCPFCNGEAHIVVCDYEGNIRDEEYERDPYSGLSYAVAHDDPNGACPMATYDEPLPWLYDSRDSAAHVWNRRAERTCEMTESHTDDSCTVRRVMDDGTIVTDEERREVARRLRDRLKTDGIGGFTSGEFGNAVYFSVMHGHRGGYGEAGSFLADLIEPPLQCPYYHSDRHYCSVHEEVQPIDHDALLALADEISRCRYLSALACEETHRVWADRIREALGVE